MWVSLKIHCNCKSDLHSFFLCFYIWAAAESWTRRWLIVKLPAGRDSFLSPSHLEMLSISCTSSSSSNRIIQPGNEYEVWRWAHLPFKPLPLTAYLPATLAFTSSISIRPHQRISGLIAQWAFRLTSVICVGLSGCFTGPSITPNCENHTVKTSIYHHSSHNSH